ncbi:MAG: ABC transporter permease [Spirochaetaceae bacterium]|nr:ABC transporter permease [Spirochaetaceae bacterium]
MRIKGKNWIFNIAVLFILLLGLAAIAAPLVSPYNPTDQNIDRRLSPPDSINFLGTDNFGRDLLSRIIFGSRSALMVGIVSASIAVTIGMTVGLFAGLGGDWVDNTLMLLMDSLLSFPTILLAITVVSFFGYGLVQVMSAIGIIYSPVFARLVRAETLAIKTESYIEASRALGTPVLKRVFIHIIPNLLAKVIVQLTITFALAVVIEASLSYLGLGTQPPTPSWGLMLKDAKDYLIQAPWMAVYPGLALAFTVFSFNLIGDTLSEKLNPRVLK